MSFYNEKQVTSLIVVVTVGWYWLNRPELRFKFGCCETISSLAQLWPKFWSLKFTRNEILSSRLRTAEPNKNMVCKIMALVQRNMHKSATTFTGKHGPDWIIHMVILVYTVVDSSDWAICCIDLLVTVRLQWHRFYKIANYAHNCCMYKMLPEAKVKRATGKLYPHVTKFIDVKRTVSDEEVNIKARTMNVWCRTDDGSFKSNFLPQFAKYVSAFSALTCQPI